MTLQTRSTTDAAQEFKKLAEFLLGTVQNESVAGFTKFAGLLKPGNVSNPVLLGYAAINRRVDDLVRLIENLRDDRTTELTRSRAVKAAREMANAFSPDNFSQNWSTVIRRGFSEANVLTLDFISPILNKHHPLPEISSDEIEDLLSKLSEAYDEIAGAGDLPGWARAPLSQGIADLRFGLDNFIVFGHDAAVSGLVGLIGTTTGTLREAEAVAGRSLKLPALFTAIATAVGVFAAPMTVSQAFPTYWGWANHLLDAARPLLAPPPKQIEGPKSVTIGKA